MRIDSPVSVSRWLGPAVTALVLGAGAPALACPDWQQTGQQIRYSADQLWTPQSLSVVAGGASNLANCAAPGVGYVAARPDFDLTLTDNSARRDLVIRVTASCDAVLLVNGADGQWSFNDDSDGFNPRLQLPAAQAGVYDIWVGTYSPTPCQATLTLETLGGTGMPSSQGQWNPSCPHPGRNGDRLSYDAGQLQRAQRFEVIAGGDTDLGACTTVPGHGHIIQSPDFTLNLTGNAQGHDLQLRVEAGCDPVLLVNDPAGQWHFNDDADGLNSRLRLPRAQPGSYDIWVGTFGRQNCQATLIAEALGGAPAPQPQPQPQPSGGVPAAAGEWSITGNGHQGYLRLNWGANGWSGLVMYDGGGVENLQGLRFDPMSGAIEFTRPLGANTQHYRGQLVGTEMRGTFNQGGGDYRYNWHATLRQSQAGPVAQPQPQPQPPAGVPAAAGTWRINGNNYPGTLTLTWSGTGWTGVVNYDVYRRDEPLENIRFDAASGSIEFTRPIPGATQIYRGRLTGGEMRGEFNQAGGAYTYTWSATLSTPQAGGGSAPFSGDPSK